MNREQIYLYRYPAGQIGIDFNGWFPRQGNAKSFSEVELPPVPCSGPVPLLSLFSLAELFSAESIAAPSNIPQVFPVVETPH